MSVYLDASVLVALFMEERFSGRAEHFLRSATPALIVSDFAAAEFASAIARRVRTKELVAERARIAFATFDAWMLRAARRIETMPVDVSTAESFVRRLDLVLRAPDAVNIAIAQRLNASLATFDRQMAKAAEALQVAVEPI